MKLRAAWGVFTLGRQAETQRGGEAERQRSREAEEAETQRGRGCCCGCRGEGPRAGKGDTADCHGGPNDMGLQSLGHFVWGPGEVG